MVMSSALQNQISTMLDGSHLPVVQARLLTDTKNAMDDELNGPPSSWWPRRGPFGPPFLTAAGRIEDHHQRFSTRAQCRCSTSSVTWLTATTFLDPMPSTPPASGPAVSGVLLDDVEDWTSGVPLDVAVQRIDPKRSNPYVQANAAGFHAGVVQITVQEYDIVVSLRDRARGVAE